MFPGFKSWKKALNGYIDRHTHSEAHKAAKEKAALFLHTSQPGMNITANISKHVAKHRIGDNIKIIRDNYLLFVCET